MPLIKIIINHKIGHVPSSEEKEFKNIRGLKVEMESTLYSLLHNNAGTEILISSEKEENQDD